MLIKAFTLAAASAASLAALSVGAQAHQDQPTGQRNQAPSSVDAPQNTPPNTPQNAPERTQPTTRGYQNYQGDQSNQSAQAGDTQICRYTTGPRQGQVIDYSGVTGAPHASIGARCADMQGSSGVAVASGTAGAQPYQQGQRLPGEGRFYTSPGAPSPWDATGQLRSGYTLTCRFNSGPRSGSSFNFTGTLGAMPIQQGQPCADGASRGVGVAANSSRHPDHPFS